MKIVLINPSQKAAYGKLKAPVYPPLGLGYLAAVLLKEGYEVEMLDMEAGRVSRGDFKKWLRQEQPQLVGFTCTTPLYDEVLKLSKIVKEEIGRVVCCGGIHPTVLAEDMFKGGDIDFVIRGEGEETLLELADILKKDGRPEDCPGLVFRKDGRIFFSRPRALISDLDSIPFPSHQLLHRFGYFYPDSRYKKCFPIITSRGCGGECTFCCSQSIFTRKFRYRQAVKVVEEIGFLKEKFGAQEIHIWDDNFTLLKRRVFEIRDELKKRRIHISFAFPNGLRVDQVDESVLAVLKEMGTYSVSFGVESGSQKILDQVRKGIKIEEIKEAFRLSRSLGLETWAFFIIGLPGEDISTIKETISLARDISPDIAKFHILKPFPGSAAYTELLAGGLIDDLNYEHFGIHTGPIHHLPGLSREEMSHWHKICYRSFYLRPGVLWSQLRRFRTFYRLRSNLRMGWQLVRQVLIK